MKRGILCLGLVIAACGVGCIPSQSLEPGELDEHWKLSPELSAGAEQKTIALEETVLPSHWTIRYEPSVLRSTISIVHGMDAIDEGTKTVNLAVSPNYTEAIGDVLVEMRAVVESMADLVEENREGEDLDRWAEDISRQLVRIERISRMTSQDPSEASGAGEEPFGLAAEPFLQMLVTYLNEHSGGELMRDMGPEEMQQLRKALAYTALRFGFAMSGRQMPDGLQEEVVETMQSSQTPEVLEKRLQEHLRKAVNSAPPSSGSLDNTLYVALKSAPKLLEMLESFMRQWDKMDSIELELLERDGRTMAAVTIAVQPDREVRLGDVMILQPTLAFRGSTRIVVIPELPVTGETSVLFEPVTDDAAAELRFDDPLYFFVRLLAIPLDDASLREVRLYRHSTSQGWNMLHVAVYMEATGGGDDPRRMIVVQDSQNKTRILEPFSVQTLTRRRTTAVNYMTPSRRYTFQRESENPAGAEDQPREP